MIGRRYRGLAVPLVVGVLGLGLAGCSNNTSDAATVSYHDGSGDHTVHITRAAFNDELRVLVTNEVFAQALKTSGRFPFAVGNVSTDQNIASAWLGTLIQQAAVDAEVNSSHITVSSADTANGAKAASSDFPAGTYSSFPKSFAQKLVDRFARINAIYTYYQTCPSGRFVSHILVKTESLATQVLAAIKSGQATFTALAKAQSIDTTSGKAGGALGCLTPGEFVTPFEAAAEAAPLGVITGPVQTQFGYHLILVRKWDPVGDQQYVQALAQAGSAVISARIRDLHVWVNPMYGSWARQTNSQGGTSFVVVPPAVPNPRVCREDKGCTPTTTTSTTVPASG